MFTTIGLGAPAASVHHAQISFVFQSCVIDPHSVHLNGNRGGKSRPDLSNRTQTCLHEVAIGDRLTDMKRDNKEQTYERVVTIGVAMLPSLVDAIDDLRGIESRSSFISSVLAERVKTTKKGSR